MSNLHIVSRLGFLALIGLIILLLIYILKPNYQQKFISSTFIWKLSLKFKKRKFPVSKLRNILIIICQILVIVLSAFLLTQPFFARTKDAPQNEEIIVIDASVNMMAAQLQVENEDGTAKENPYYDATRFERAIEEALSLGNKAFEEKKKVTVIIAGTTARYLQFEEETIIDGIDTTVSHTILHCGDKGVFNRALDTLVEKDETGNVISTACDYTGADMDGAIELVDELSKGNAGAMITILTGKDYTSKSVEDYKSKNGERAKFRILNLAKNDANEYGANKEWNAAILSCASVRSEGGYKFTVEVACYNNELDIPVFLEIYGADGGDETQVYQDISRMIAECREEKPFIVTFVVPVRSFISARVYINESDSFSLDNSFYHYGSGKNEVNVICVSPAQSNQYGALLQSFFMLGNQWEFNVRSTSLEELEMSEQDISEGGYDIYIFEHDMPKKFPNDGIVIMVSPKEEPTDMGLIFGELVNKIAEDNSLCTLSSAVSSQLMNYVDPSRLIVNQFRRLNSYDGYRVLMTATDLDGNPCPAYLTNDQRKVAVINFASVWADISIRNELCTMYYDIIKSWLPATIEKYVYDVGESIKYWQEAAILVESAPEITLSLSNGRTITTKELDSYYVSQSIYGRYTVKQNMFSGKEITETYFVKIAADESNFTSEIKLASVTIPPLEIDDPKDIFIYVAIALITIAFAERLLHARDGL